MISLYAIINALQKKLFVLQSRNTPKLMSKKSSIFVAN